MRKKRAFTLLEMLVTMSIVAMLTLGAGALLAGGQRNWNHLYGRVYGDPAIDSFLVQRVFNSVCGKASLRKCVIGDEQDWLEVYYWDEASTAQIPENYARIYKDEADVYVDHGKLVAGSWDINTQEDADSILIAHDVDQLVFEAQDKALRMYLTYQDPNILPVVSSAVRHNK